jgi:biotin carboxylase
LKEDRYDVLFPSHDQVYLLARFPELVQGLAACALPPLDGLEKMQSKAAFTRLLDALSLPHPPTVIVSNPVELDREWSFPCYIKLAYGTAGTGVWYVRERPELEQLVSQLAKESSGFDQEILVQQPGQGTFSVTQSVFREGQLIAAHSYKARALGVGGSARCRESVSHPMVTRHLAHLGEALRWHGALHVEYLYDEHTDQPAYIDANPRIGETMNATLSGTNLCQLLVQISLGVPTGVPAPSRIGTRTHSLLTSVLAAANGGRRTIATEWWQTFRHRGLYAGSEEELTRLREDWISAIPLVAVTAQLLARPAAAHRIVRASVENYGLSAAAAAKIRATSMAATMS